MASASRTKRHLQMASTPEQDRGLRRVSRSSLESGLERYKKRIVSMLAVMRRLVALEKEFCRATAEEKRLERLADGLQQEVDHLARWSHQQRVSIVWILQPRAW
jgi:hypothetical protein